MTGSDNLFARHLDLSPLRGRRRGLVPCRFHDDRTGSLSLDLDRGLFHCFGCGVKGGLKRFAELVGEQIEQTAPSLPLSPRSRWTLEEARVRMFAQARRQMVRLEPYRDLATVSGFIRQSFQIVDHARRVARAAGPSERVWDVLVESARLETEALATEAEVDDVLIEGPLA